MLIYFIVFFIIYFFPKLRKITILFLTICRYDVGWDYPWYYKLGTRIELNKIGLFINKEDIGRYFECYKEDFWNYYRMEILNKIIYKTGWFFNLPANFSIIIYGFFLCVLIFSGFKYYKLEKNRNVWLVFYVFPLFLLNFFNIIRQGVAVAIIFFVSKYLFENKLIKYFCGVILASMIHKSAIIGLVFYFIFKIKKKLLIIWSIPLIYFLKGIVVRVYIYLKLPFFHYLTRQYGIGGEKIYYLIVLIYIGIVLLTLLDKEFFDSNKENIKLVIIGCCIYINFLEYGHAAIRISTYFLIFILCLVPAIEKSLEKIFIKYLKIYLPFKGLISILLLCLLFVNLYNDKVRKNYRPTLEYKTIFQREE